MKLLVKLFLLWVITSFSVAIVSAQSPPAPPKPTKIVGKAKIYESKTTTRVESVFLNRNDKQTIRAKFEVPSDQASSKPKGVEFFYQSFSDNGFKYKDNRKIAFIIDNKGTAQSEAKLIASCNLKKEKECYEFLMSPLLPYAYFEAMLKAKVVKIQFGNTIFELTPEEKDGLRDLQRTLGK